MKGTAKDCVYHADPSLPSWHDDLVKDYPEQARIECDDDIIRRVPPVGNRTVLTEGGLGVKTRRGGWVCRSVVF